MKKEEARVIESELKTIPLIKKEIVKSTFEKQIQQEKIKFEIKQAIKTFCSEINAINCQYIREYKFTLAIRKDFDKNSSKETIQPIICF
jgi:hypothetical protein